MTSKKKTMWKMLITIMILLSMQTVYALNDTQAPLILGSSPSGIQNTQNIVLQLTSNENAYCKYNLTDTIYANMANSFDELNTTSHTSQLILTDGSYAYYARCTDDSKNNMTSSELISFEIDSTSPTITQKSPDGTVTGERIILNITTNEDTTCQYDTSYVSYDDMTGSFDLNGGTVHEEELLHLGEGQKTYYISCKDNADNIVTNTLTFNVVLPVSASISLGATPPLSVGTYKVTVSTTKNLGSAPNLNYKFDDSTTSHSISVIGEDKTWTGYLVIADADLDRVAKFQFSGTDFNGITGTKITGGELVLVDTKKPPAVTTLTSYQEDNDIKLKWFYDGESEKEFNIYRSEKSGVEYTDYYDKTTASTFLDEDTDPGITYYYRIAVVDKAGNIGEISTETHTQTEEDYDRVVSIPQYQTDPESLASNLQIKLNSTIKRIKNDLLDIEASISNIEKTTDEYELLVIDNLGLEQRAKNSKKIVDDTLLQLDEIFLLDIDEVTLDNKIDSAIAKVENAKKEAALKIDVQDSLKFTQSLDQTDIETAIKELALRQDFETDIFNEYTKNSTIIAETANVYISIAVAVVEYISHDEEEISVVKKEVTFDSPVANANIVEIIPKGVALKSDDLSYSKPPRILNDDPVVSWAYPSITNEEVSYFSDEIKDLNDLKRTKTVILLNPANFKTEFLNDDNELTGGAISNYDFGGLLSGIKGSLGLIIGVFVIMGLLVYYFFFIKEDEQGSVFHTESELATKIMPTTQNIAMQSLQEKADKMLKEQEESLPEFNENNEPNDIIEYKHMLNLIDHALSHVDNLNFEAAKKEYKLIHEIFSNTKFQTNEAKSKALGEITNLYSKLSISIKVDNAHRHAQSKDTLALSKVIDELKTVLEILKTHEDKDTPLKNFATDYILYYSNILKNFERKNETNIDYVG